MILCVYSQPLAQQYELDLLQEEFQVRKRIIVLNSTAYTHGYFSHARAAPSSGSDPQQQQSQTPETANAKETKVEQQQQQQQQQQHG